MQLYRLEIQEVNQIIIYERETETPNQISQLLALPL